MTKIYEDQPLHLIACEIDASSKTVEVLVAPYGEVVSVNGSFLIDEEAFALIMESFKARGVDIPFDLEHHTVGGEYSPPDGSADAQGWITDMRLEKGRGIIATVAWNEEGRERILSKKYKYPSPTLAVRESDKRAVSLHSVAMTNKPAIPHIEPLVAKQSINMKEQKTMLDENGQEVSGEVNQDAFLGAIARELGVPIEALNGDKLLPTILDAVMKLKGDGGDGVEGEAKSSDTDETTVANSVCAALGLTEGSDTNAVTLAINTLKQSDTNLAAMKIELATLSKKIACNDRRELLSPFKDVIGIGENEEDRKTDREVILALAASSPDQCKHMLKQRQAMLPPQGRTNEPAPKVTSDDRASIIANAAKEFDDDNVKYGSKPSYVLQVLKEKKLSPLSEDERKTLVTS